MDHLPAIDAVVLDVVRQVEPDLPTEVVLAVLQQVAGAKAKQRRIAQALADHPDLLTCGRPDGPVAVDQFVHRLLAAGAQHVVAPRCPDCGKTTPLTEGTDETRICLSCKTKRRHPTGPCPSCQIRWQRPYLDRHGRRVCRACRPGRNIDPVALLCDQLRAVEPDMDPDTLATAVRKVGKQPYDLLKLSWELEESPRLLSGDGAHGSPRLIRLITELRHAGARNVVVPPCPRCGREARLTNTLEGLRVCKSCYSRASPMKQCAGCGRQRPPVGRTATGEPLCQLCYRQDPLLHEQCTTCGQTRFIVRRAGDERFCNNCYQLPLAHCALCGRHRHCLGVAAGTPRCESCATKKWPCVRCGKTLQIAARTPEGRLCHTCYEKDPVSFRPCTGCGAVERLHHHGLCARCALARRLDELLTTSDPAPRPELEALRRVLLTGNPAERMLQWLQRSEAGATLTEIVAGTCPLTHEALDQRLSATSSRHLRGILVTAGILQPRDEHLAALDRWLNTTLDAVEDPTRRKLLRRFVTWHHLGRLRRKLRGQFAEAAQTAAIRAGLRAALALLRWLDTRELALATCRQADIDTWIAGGPSTRYQARGFLQWAVRNGHASQVEIPDYQRASQTTPLDADHRWTLARQLLADQALATSDRVAGLFTLLYAQPVSTIARLTTEHITSDATGTGILFGDTPLLLPEPGAVLLAEHLQTRSSRSVVSRNHDSRWLFPGADPTRHVSVDHLSLRLKRLGIYSRPGRHAALLDLATQLPGAVLARLLGISTSAASRWIDRSGSSWANYASTVQRRSPHQ